MLRDLFDLYRSLTDPLRLSHLLHTLLAGWAGYAALFAVVYSETGLLVGFFCPAIRSSSLSAWWRVSARWTSGR